MNSEWDYTLFYHIATISLRMAEETFWESTLRKLFALVSVNKLIYTQRNPDVVENNFDDFCM